MRLEQRLNCNIRSTKNQWIVNQWRRSASAAGPALKCGLVVVRGNLLRGSGIALVGSLQVSNGGVLGTSCMQKQGYGHGPCYLTVEVSLPRAYSARSSYITTSCYPRYWASADACATSYDLGSSPSGGGGAKVGTRLPLLLV